MRVLHTSDWHLGRSLMMVPLIEDQRFVLNQIIEIVEKEKPHVTVVAGDLFDRINPPAEAIELMDWVMKRLVLDLHQPVILIAGNHDSAERIDCFSGLLVHAGMHVFGKLRFPSPTVGIEDEHGPVVFYPVPYADPESVRFHLKDDGIKTHSQAYERTVSEINGLRGQNERAVLIGHTFIASGRVSESERKMTVGGVEAVESSVMNGFSYAALGHLHEPQQFGDGNVRYAGSILKYSASESLHRKSVTMVEIDANGKPAIREILLRPLRDYRRVRGDIEDGVFRLESEENKPQKDDFLEVTLTNEDPVMDPMATIQKSFPNTLNLLWAKRGLVSGPQQLFDAARVRRMGAEGLFELFYREVAGKELPEEQRVILRQANMNIPDEDAE
jgi:exonuclease SbcD